MLYTILPPIIVVLSLIGIIVFLAKKAPQVALLEDGRKAVKPRHLESARKKSLFGRIFFRSDSPEKSNLKRGLLFFLEKFTRRLRIFFLKLENLFTHWSESLKRKRKNQVGPEENVTVPPAVPLAVPPKIIRESDVVDRIKRYEQARHIHPNEAGEIKMRFGEPEAQERTIKPMISDRLVVPRSRPEIKNRLERILIERIASNPKDIEAYERLGEYYFEIENYEYSKECFKQVIKLNPMNIGVKSKMKKLERLLTRR